MLLFVYSKPMSITMPTLCELMKKHERKHGLWKRWGSGHTRQTEGTTFKQNKVYLSKDLIVKAIDFESICLLYITLLNANLVMIMLFHSKYGYNCDMSPLHHFSYHCFSATKVLNNFEI